MMAANFNPVDFKPDLKKAVKDFSLFKVDLANHLDVSTIQQLSTLLGLKRGQIDRIKRSETPGLEMVNHLDERGCITPTDISYLLDLLQKLELAGLAAKIQSSFQAKNSQAKKDQELEEKQLVASSASSSSQKGDRTEKQLVASSASSSTAKSAPSQNGDGTEKQLVASSASSSTAKSPTSQIGDDTEKQSVASSASSSPAKSPPSQNGDGTDVKDKLFISFSSKTKKKVTELVGRIESLVGDGSCWMYLNKNLPGDSVAKNISDAIENAVIVLCIINQDYLDSVPCEEEFLLAKESGKQIILLHMEKISRPYKKTNRGNSRMQLGVTDKVYARMYENFEEEFQKVIAKIKECLFGRNANASGSPSTSGSRKRKSSNDGDASGVKVTKKE